MCVKTSDGPEGFAGAEPGRKLAIPRYLGPINFRFAAQENIGIGFLKPVSEVRDRGIVINIRVKAVYIGEGDADMLMGFGAGPWIAKVGRRLRGGSIGAGREPWRRNRTNRVI